MSNTVDNLSQNFAEVAYQIACSDDVFSLLVVFAPIVAYLIGSISFGVILTRCFGYGDLRKIGSGNTGATNVLRTGNKKLAAFTLLLDSGKGAIIVIIYILLASKLAPQHCYQDRGLIVGLFAVLGHCSPTWLKFKGGKGVATTIGVLLVAVPYAGLAAVAAWILTAKITKISSLSALVAVGIAPIVTFFVYGSYPAGICALITLLVWVRHKDNIKRLLNGEEPKIGSKKKESASEPVSK